MAIINESIKNLKKTIMILRSKKVTNLINNRQKESFKKSTLGGCIFYKKGYQFVSKR